jgi:hypothetical protein
MTTTPDLDAATDRFAESLSSARDVAVSAFRDEIAPAVAAAVDAARDASGPVYAEAASRAGDAVSALRGSDAAKALGNSRAAKALGAKTSRRRRKWPIVAGLVGLGAAGATILKRRAQAPEVVAVVDVSDPTPETPNAS